MAFRVTSVLRTYALSKWAFDKSGFCKYGLYRDDCLLETEDVAIALKRLPQHIIDERNFRQVRAIQLSIAQVVLPKEEWTKFEDDVLYLTPIVDQVKKEKQEIEEWEQNN